MQSFLLSQLAERRKTRRRRRLQFTAQWRKLRAFDKGKDPEGVDTANISDGPSWSGQYPGSYPGR